MTFRSILFADAERPADRIVAEPDCLADLNLDQIVAAITAGREDYALEAFFHEPLIEVDDVVYRQEVMEDLKGAPLIDRLGDFAEAMRTVRAYLGRAEGSAYRAEKGRWHLDAVVLYCNAVARLVDDIGRAGVASRGLTRFREHAARYVASQAFVRLRDEAAGVSAALAEIRYALLIYRLRVEVRPPSPQPDYGAEIEALFERFRQGDVEPFPFRHSRSDILNQVDLKILDLVAKMHSDVFARLGAFRADHPDFLDPTIVRFDREIQFYLATLEHIERFERMGLSFCLPSVSREAEAVRSVGGFDLALAGTLGEAGGSIVCNDFHLAGSERIIVVTGPNQGGKTTFARAIGQLHYLASLGCPVPGRRASLSLCDRIFTHFETREDVADLSGKLKDDLTRMRTILNGATARSLVIVNEIFSSTTLQDARVLGKSVLDELTVLGPLCVWVTFIDELASGGERTVSMVSTVSAENPNERTFRVLRRPADGLAYALSIAEKHGLTEKMIEERLGP